MSYWKRKILPNLNKLLHKSSKAQAADQACRAFDKAKDAIAVDIVKNKKVLQLKVVAVYRSSNDETKVLMKEPTEPGVVEFFELTQNLLIELSNAGCPGAQALSDAATQHGLTAMSKPIVFLLSKLTDFVADEKPPVLTKNEKKETNSETKFDELVTADITLKAETPQLTEESTPAEFQRAEEPATLHSANFSAP